MGQADTPGEVAPTRDLPQDTVITGAGGAITLTIPARSDGGWKLTYCGHEYSDDCTTGIFPDFEFKLPRKDGGFDVFPFNSLRRQFGEPYSIKPGLGRKFQNIVIDRRLRLVAALATLVVSVAGIVFCNTSGDDDKDVDDPEPPVTDNVEPDGIG